MKNALAILAVVLIIGNLASDNFGLYPITGAESIGASTWSVLVYVGGGWLIYRALKEEKKV
jgi:hypothetical protein